MKSSCALSLACIALTLVAADAQTRKVRWNAPPEEWQWVVPGDVPGTVHKTIQSESMGHDVGYNISLPPSYEKNPNLRFPVVYFLHGAGGSERSDADPSTVHRMIHNGEIGEVIYVYPNGGHFSKYRDWPKANVKAETFIIRELIPHIDKKYRTIASRDGRALSGWSMGGDASLRFAFKYPEMFCAAGTYSAAIDWEAPQDDSIFNYSKTNVAKIKDRVGVMMVVGEEDRLFGAHQRLISHLEESGIKHSLRSIPEVGHNLGLMKQHTAGEITRMLAKHYSPATSDAVVAPHRNEEAVIQIKQSN